MDRKLSPSGTYRNLELDKERLLVSWPRFVHLLFCALLVGVKKGPFSSLGAGLGPNEVGKRGAHLLQAFISQALIGHLLSIPSGAGPLTSLVHLTLSTA